MTAGAIAGIALGGLAVLLLGALLAWYMRRRGQGIPNGLLFKRVAIDEPSYHAVEPFIMPTAPASYEPSESRFPPQPRLPIVSSGSHSISQHSHVPIAATSEKSTRPAVTGAHSSRSHSTTFDVSSPAVIERHMDAGPVPMLSRSDSGRLPPAYGEQRD
jgi:hypothetical protein